MADFVFNPGGASSGGSANSSVSASYASTASVALVANSTLASSSAGAPNFFANSVTASVGIQATKVIGGSNGILTVESSGSSDVLVQSGDGQAVITVQGGNVSQTVEVVVNGGSFIVSSGTPTDLTGPVTAALALSVGTNLNPNSLTGLVGTGSAFWTGSHNYQGAITASAGYFGTASFATFAAATLQGSSNATSASFASTASVVQNVTVITGSQNSANRQLTSSIVVQPGWTGGYLLFDPNTSSLSVNLPTHSLGQSFNIRNIGLSGSLIVADNNNVTQSMAGQPTNLFAGMYMTFIDDGLKWWVY